MLLRVHEYLEKYSNYAISDYLMRGSVLLAWNTWRCRQREDSEWVVTLGPNIGTLTNKQNHTGRKTIDTEERRPRLLHGYEIMKDINKKQDARYGFLTHIISYWLNHRHTSLPRLN